MPDREGLMSLRLFSSCFLPLARYREVLRVPDSEGLTFLRPFFPVSVSAWYREVLRVLDRKGLLFLRSFFLISATGPGSRGATSA